MASIQDYYGDTFFKSAGTTYVEQRVDGSLK